MRLFFLISDSNTSQQKEETKRPHPEEGEERSPLPKDGKEGNTTRKKRGGNSNTTKKKETKQHTQRRGRKVAPRQRRGESQHHPKKQETKQHHPTEDGKKTVPPRGGNGRQLHQKEKKEGSTTWKRSRLTNSESPRSRRVGQPGPGSFVAPSAVLTLGSWYWGFAKPALQSRCARSKQTFASAVTSSTGQSACEFGLHSFGFDCEIYFCNPCVPRWCWSTRRSRTSRLAHWCWVVCSGPSETCCTLCYHEILVTGHSIQLFLFASQFANRVLSRFSTLSTCWQLPRSAAHGGNQPAALQNSSRLSQGLCWCHPGRKSARNSTQSFPPSTKQSRVAMKQTAWA